MIACRDYLYFFSVPAVIIAHKCPAAQRPETSLINNSSLHQGQAIPSWYHPGHTTGHDRFRKIFLDHWHTWCDLHLSREGREDFIISFVAPSQ